MSLAYTVRPISDRTWWRPAGARERSRFTTSWTRTLTDLGRELEHLGGRDLVIEIDIREQDLRLDGTLRANARPVATDAVVVAFESTKGPLQYRSDIYDAVAWGARGVPAWQHNVRAVVLTLEALRAVGRYGASALDEQYRGYKAIGSGGATPSGMTTGLAVDLLIRESGLSEVEVSGTQGGLARAARVARANAHPDRNDGDRSAYDAVDEAVQVLTRAGLL